MRLAAGLLVFVSLATIGGGAAPRLSPQDWLPPNVAERLAQQLASRLETIGPGAPSDRDGLLSGARQQVGKLRAAFDDWGERGVLDRAPVFTQLTLPASGQPHLDAMRRYQVCNLVLTVQFLTGDEIDDKRAGAMGLTAITMAVVFLRQPFVAGGGTDADIEAFLTGAPMARASARIQADQAVFDHVASACTPVVADLFSVLG